MLVMVGLVAAGSAATAQDQMPPKQVGVVEMKLEKVPRIITLPGRAVAAEEAAIRPRVGGIVTDILYQPGEMLTAGTPMFRIDATTYEAAVVSAEAEVVAAEAALTQATLAYNRAEKLAGSGSTIADVETAQSTMKQAEARLNTAKADLKVAKAELNWTTITSPIKGYASVAGVSVGDLVTAAQSDALATVTLLDPIDVDMYEPSVRILNVIKDVQSGRLEISNPIKMTLTLEDGTTYEASGELLASGFRVSTSTGSVTSRFRFENHGRRLLPGMFLRGQIELGTIDAFLVSHSATTRDRTGQLTAWVAENGEAMRRELTDVGSWKNSWIVTDGVEVGDLVIADGFSGLTSGATVTMVPVEYDASGVVRNVVPASNEEPAATSNPASAE
ncbi:efflux RND transporter periplasmic adaptor subunit (plasmid) [Qingshengfaniella alkalisoli]|uniref:Efflux RND transporter periplasmic adaptor subunit n=2 Tax=Qingshengfaniella alkalisoli TaxID=2599296 RepID=A0A5B8J4T6_9RHOB|nr:efflux RND transporter periplasmic adaptor subunit [Qingshengfaniella alkalisoli]